MPWQKKNDGIQRVLPTAKHESDQMRDAFEKYWAMKPRSMRGLSDMIGVSVTTIARWARSFDWKKRIIEREAFIGAQVAQDVVVQETKLLEKGMKILDDWENILLGIAKGYLDHAKYWIDDPTKKLDPERFEKVARIIMDIKQPKELKQNNVTLPTIINVIPKEYSSSGPGTGRSELSPSNDGRGEIIEGSATEISVRAIGEANDTGHSPVAPPD